MSLKEDMIPIYISRIRESNDVDEQVMLFQDLNQLLPPEKRMHLPSLVTRDFIYKAVNNIQEIWLQPAATPA